MKPLKLIFTVATIAVVAISCESNELEKKAYDALMKNVMAVHDEVMPKMGEINTLIGQLEAKADTTELGQKFADAKKELETASTGMMDWMQGFGEKFEVGENVTDSLLQKLEMLKTEQESIQKVKEQINSSIEKAKALLQENQ